MKKKDALRQKRNMVPNRRFYKISIRDRVANRKKCHKLMDKRWAKLMKEA